MCALLCGASCFVCHDLLDLCLYPVFFCFSVLVFVSLFFVSLLKDDAMADGTLTPFEGQPHYQGTP